MLKWKYNEEPNGTFTLWTCDLDNIFIFIEKEYLAITLKSTNPTVILYEEDFPTAEEAKDCAEQWLKNFFRPIIRHAVAEIGGTEWYHRTKLEAKTEESLNAILETISLYNYTEHGEQNSD